MAAVSTYSDGRGGYSSHGNQNGGGSPWDFSAPINTENIPTNSQSFAANETHPLQKPNHDRQQYPRTSERNIHPGTNGIQSQSKQASNIDSSYLSPYKQGARPGLSASRSGSEADSLIDLYGHPRGLGERSAGNSMDKDRAIPPEELYLDDEDPERSRWIHRDKLAIIESHEMQEAGIQLPPQQKRSASKSKTRKESIHSQDVPAIPSQEPEVPPVIEHKKRRTWSPVRNGEADETLWNQYDLRTPEEIAAGNEIDQNPSNLYPQQDLRKSSSRIPLPRSSPMPIPQGHIERDTPLPRKRGASGNWTGDETGLSYNRLRSRGNSVGSQVLLDDPDASYNTPTPASRPGSNGSPTATRTKPTPTHNRKPSLVTGTPPTNSLPKPRQPSSTNSPRTPSTSTARPKSRSGLDPRPATAINRPEGEAPWLATMYKPDPRLPPDQQLLPTHAKRLQQEQWERAQKDPSLQYQQPHQQQNQLRIDPSKPSPQLPREFSPLAEHTLNGLQPPSSRDENPEHTGHAGQEWPLTLATTSNSNLNPNISPVSPISPASHHLNNNSPNSNKPVPNLPPASRNNSNAGYTPLPPRGTQGGSPISPARRAMDPFEKERVERLEREKGDAAVGGGGGGVGEKQGEGKEKKGKGCGCCVVM